MAVKGCGAKGRHHAFMHASWMLPIVAIIAIGCVPRATTPSSTTGRPEQFRQLELRRLVLQDCSSCHGERLTGAIGPPLTAQALAGKTTSAIATIILEGRHATPMPAWSRSLSEPEATWIAETLQQGAIDLR